MPAWTGCAGALGQHDVFGERVFVACGFSPGSQGSPRSQPAFTPLKPALGWVGDFVVLKCGQRFWNEIGQTENPRSVFLSIDHSPPARLSASASAPSGLRRLEKTRLSKPLHCQHGQFQSGASLCRLPRPERRMPPKRRSATSCCIHVLEIVFELSSPNCLVRGGTV
jgi:hypothetical protein